MSKNNKELSTTQVIMLGFLSVILVGSLLLMMPFSSADGTFTPYLTALFTSTTSVCVTGLVVVDTYAHWSFIGQLIILVLIQCGGLGVVTLSTYIMTLLGRKIGLKQRLLLEDALNLSTLSGLVKFIKKVFWGTLIIEGIGALLYMTVFIPEFGFKGIWISIFNSISAFCNAGMDVIGPVSLVAYVNNPIINFTTMGLIIIGGIGFIVWWDLISVGVKRRNKEIYRHQIWSRLQFHTKIVLAATMVLIVVGFLAVLILEYNNPQTLGQLGFFSKLQAALFQSVTTRTAGFMTISQLDLKDSTALICMILMFIGGSPVGTAGGIKTTTAAVLIIAVFSTIKGSDNTTIFKRNINPVVIRKSLAVTVISLCALLTGTIILLSTSDGSFVDVTYEAFSAIGTVGLSRAYTANLNIVGRIVIIILMYLGRTGPISLAMAFTNIANKNKNRVQYPEGGITVG